MKEPKEILRRYCELSNCRIWKALKESESDDDEVSELRQHCAETCPAYQFNRFINMSSLKIVDKGTEKY